jgi:hypothetical protein
MGAAPATGPTRRDGCWNGPSGWAAARVKGTAVFLRAGSYRHRPSHIDPLHLDVRFDGAEVVTDPGTYAYNAPRPWANGLAGAAVHNGPLLDGHEPAERGPRFLWYSWPSARVLRASYDDGEATLAAEIPDRVLRELTVASERVEVTDRVLDASARSAQVTWLIHPEACSSYRVDAPDAQVVRAAEGDVGAWFSPTYGLRIPTVAIRITSTAAAPMLLRTVIHRPSQAGGGEGP